MTDRVVIVGGGQAAASAAFRLRSGGFSGAVDIFGDEGCLPYQRPPLSKKYLKGLITLDRLLIRPDTLYLEHDIKVHLGCRVVSLDPQEHVLTTDRGVEVAYDKLIIAAGATPRVLSAEVGGDLENVFTIRSLEDAEKLKKVVRTGNRLLIVGGGYIGLEMAAVGIELGLEVTLLEALPRILQRVAAKETSNWFRALHLSHGVDLREGVGLERLLARDGRAELAALTDGTAVGVDLIVVGIGVLPNDALARSAGLEAENGILTDKCCRTSNRDIYAIGDCALFNYRDQWTRFESVPNASGQGEYVADHILGVASEAYAPEPWFWSDQYDVSLKIAGLNRGYDRVVQRSGDGERAVSHWYFGSGKFLAVDAMNDPKAFMIGKRWLSQNVTPDASELAHATLPLNRVSIVPTPEAA